jgi:hypothetical protein
MSVLSQGLKRETRQFATEEAFEETGLVFALAVGRTRALGICMECAALVAVAVARAVIRTRALDDRFEQQV